jgi:ADP-ribose pyrophosphatase
MQEILLEIPAGRLKQNEDKEDCAKRELLEEIGMIARNIKRVFSFFSSPGFCNEIVHLYVATELTYKEQQLDEGEFLEVVKVPIKKAVEMIYRGEIKDAKTIAGILHVALKMQMHLTCDENF